MVVVFCVTLIDDDITNTDNDEDPLISVLDYSDSVYLTVYGENGASDNFEGAAIRGGANVWIRNKTDETRYCDITNQYIGVHKQFNYTSSINYCNDNFGTHLATIESNVQNTLARDSVTLLNVPAYESIWMGLNDLDSENSWDRWDDGSTVTYTKWSPGEPNDAHSGQDCACLLIENFWDDVECAYEYYFVCNSPTS